MNKYLEKIAGLGSVAGKIGGTLLKGVKYAGNQLHLATGGAYINYAHDKLGIKHVADLAEFGSSEAARKRLGKAHTISSARRAASDSGQKAMDMQFHQDMQGLHKQTSKSRLVVGSMVAAPTAAYALKKHIDKKREENQMYSSYPNYNYNY